MITTHRAQQYEQMMAAIARQSGLSPMIGVWRRQQQQQQQADPAGETETITVGENDIEVDKGAAQILRDQGRDQATIAIRKRAIRDCPPEMEIAANAKPTDILAQSYKLIKTQTETLAAQDTEITTLKETPPPEPEPNASADEIKKIREDAAEQVRVAKQSITDAAKESADSAVEQSRAFAKREAYQNIRSSAQRDLGLSESSSNLYTSMIDDVFSHEIEEDNGKFNVVFTEKGQEYAFAPEGKTPTSFQIAEMISKAHLGNHSNGVPGSSGARPPTASAGTSGKPLHEMSQSELDKSWD